MLGSHVGVAAAGARKTLRGWLALNTGLGTGTMPNFLPVTLSTMILAPAGGAKQQQAASVAASTLKRRPPTRLRPIAKHGFVTGIPSLAVPDYVGCPPRRDGTPRITR
jgi:hypothetical protein